MSIQEQINKQSEKLTSLLQIEAPLIAAPMMGVTTAEMTAAFSNAGGLGVMPCGIMKPEQILETVKTIKELTDKPFALNLRVPPRETEDEAATKILFDALEPLRDELGVAHQLAEIPTFDEQYGGGKFHSRGQGSQNGRLFRHHCSRSGGRRSQTVF